MDESDFVEPAIQELLSVGSIVSCTSPPDVVNPLSVSVQSSGRKKLILDLSHIYFFVNKSKMKFDDAQRFLSFSWVFNGVRKHFKFVVLRFGLCTGPCIFTKVMRPSSSIGVVRPSAL